MNGFDFKSLSLTSRLKILTFSCPRESQILKPSEPASELASRICRAAGFKGTLLDL